MGKEEKRLYFIIRAWFMSLIGALLFLGIVYIMRTIDFIQSVVFGVFVFIASLVVSRLFDSPIEKLVEKILGFLEGHKKLKSFILKCF